MKDKGQWTKTKTNSTCAGKNGFILVLLLSCVLSMSHLDFPHDKVNPIIYLARYHMFFEDLARLSEKGGQPRHAEIYQECAEMAKQVSHN